MNVWRVACGVAVAGCLAIPARGQVANRAENPGFAGDLRAWSLQTRPAGSYGTASWSSLDSGTGSSLGSVRLTNGFSGPTSSGTVAVAQCIAGGVTETSVNQPSARVFVPAGQTPEFAVFVGAFYYSGPNCDGTLNAEHTWGLLSGPAGTGGEWVALLRQPAPAGAGSRSALLEVELLSFGDGGTHEAYFDDVGFSGPALFVKGDMNRDGETDLLLHNTVSGENQVWFMNNTVRDGAPATITPAPASLDWVVAGVDDFNADQQNDLLMWNTVTGAAEFWLMSGTTRVGAPVTLAGALAPPWKPSATADFNHDGRPDIVYRNSSTQKIVVWTMNGTSRLGEIVPVPDQAVDNNWEIVAALDFNYDTNADLLWYNATSGKIVLWFMDASVQRISGQFTNPPNAGDSNWRVLAGGDYGIGPGGLWGTPDIVWRNATSGRFVVWHMDRAGNRTFGEFTAPMEPTPVPTDWTIAGPR
jgi:hypothetical protein